MKITDKNRAKMRRELEEGDKITFLRNGVGPAVTATVTWPGMRGASDFCSAQAREIAAYPVSIDYHRITEWYKNR